MIRLMVTHLRGHLPWSVGFMKQCLKSTTASSGSTIMMTIFHIGSFIFLALHLGCILLCGRVVSCKSVVRRCGSIWCPSKSFPHSQPSVVTTDGETTSSPERSLGMKTMKKGWQKDRELQTLQRYDPGSKFNTQMDDVGDDGFGQGDQEFVPIVDEKYANAARLVNEYVSRDKPFEETYRPCPQTNWMRVQGTTGRCFKSFDFTEFRHRQSDADDGGTLKQVGTWEEAERICMSFGAHLAALYTTAEMKFAHMVLDRRPDACWIGLRRLELHRTRRHSDTSNGWKWITSEGGILDDTDSLEWHRDWAPVWDSISYGKPLCGVFTRKGIAARRCYSFPGPTGSLADFRGKKGQRASPEKLLAPELSCFLCATFREMKAPEDSFAYAAENGLIEWADTKETRFSSTASSSDMVSEDRYNDSGDDRTKVERRHSKEGKKPTWGLNKQHERNSVKALKWQAETEPRNASRQTDDEGTEHGLEHKVPIDLHASPEKHEGRQEQMNQRMRGFHGSAATGYSTAASSGTEYGAAEKGQSDVTTESETKALALSREEDNDMSDAAMPANHDIIDTSGARETAGSENTQTTVTSPSSIRDNESYSAFLREFMRLHKQAKETLNRRRDSVAATDPTPEEVSASGETAGLPTDSSASSTEAVYGTGDEDPQDGVVGPPQILSGVDTKTENPATSASRLALELPQAMPSSADPPVELHNSADVTVLSRIDVSTTNVALLPAAPASTPKPNGRTKQVPANSNVKILHVVTWCAGTAIFVVGAALILIYIRCWVVPQEPPASDGGSATTAPRSSSSPSLLAFTGCPAESSLSGPVPFQTGSCCSPSKDLGIPTVKTSESNPSPYANVGSPASNGSESCSHSHTVSIVSFSGPECCDDGETNEGEQEIDTATSSTSRSAKFERIGCDTFVSAIVRGVRVAAGVSQVSRSTEDSVSGSTAVESSQLPCRSSDNSRQSHRPSPAERLERLRARIDAL